MQAMIATPNTFLDPFCYADSGAIHHCTSDPHNLYSKQTFTENATLLILKF